MSVKVLVIDDEETFRVIVPIYLQEVADIEIMVATSVRQACDLIDAHKFGLIVSDMQIPPKTGLHLLSYLREYKGDLKTPFILMSSDMTGSLKATALRDGANACFDKSELTALAIEGARLLQESPV